jgi:hypothetical protein
MDPQIGRFLQVDPLATKFPYNSPYTYAEDKVTIGIDLEGLELLPVLGLDPPVTEIPIEDMVETGAKVSEAGTRTADVSKSSETQSHHLFPRQFKEMKLLNQRKGGFKFEGKENKMERQKYNKEAGGGQHGGAHPNYNNEVGKRLTQFKKDNPNSTPEQAAKFARGLVKEMKETIQNNPNTKVNDLFKAATPVIPKDNTAIKPPVNTMDVKPPAPRSCKHCILL